MATREPRPLIPEPNPLPVEALGADALLATWDRVIIHSARARAHGDTFLADDLAQEARIRLWQASQSGAAVLDSHARRHIRFALLDGLRRELRYRRHHAGDEGLELTPDCPGGGQGSERAAVVTAWAAMLPERQREVYRHLVLEERTQAEAARLLKVSQPRVAQLRFRLLERGRQELAHLAA